MSVTASNLAGHMRNMAAFAGDEGARMLLNCASTLEQVPDMTREGLAALNGAWARGERVSKFQPRTPPGTDPTRQALAA